MTTPRIENIAKSYQGRTVLDGLSLALTDRGITVLVGESGCGKTTLLRLLAGLETPDKGALPRFGSVAMVFQEPRLLPWLTVEDNIALAARAHPKSEQRRLALEALDKVGLLHCAGLRPGALSGGMAQRAAIARALVGRPALLLMDEPFSALDALTRDRVRREFIRLHLKNPVTTVLVTHDVMDAVLLGDRIVKLSRGRIEREWTVSQAHPRSFTHPQAATLAENILESFYADQPSDTSSGRPADTLH